jgi:L-fuculose-phosphate aldolase
MSRKKISITPVGIVRSGIKERHDMRRDRFDAEIIIYPEYIKALKGINKYSHIWVLSYLHQGQRDVLQARKRKYAEKGGYQGVFTVSSPDRPNLIGLSKVRLISSRKGVLKVKGLDLVDGTPVIDIKTVKNKDE